FNNFKQSDCKRFTEFRILAFVLLSNCYSHIKIAALGGGSCEKQRGDALSLEHRCNNDPSLMAPPKWLCLSKLLSATKKGGCHVSSRSACGYGCIGSRTTFQRSHSGPAHAGDRNQLCHQRFGRQCSARRWIANVGDACFCPNQLPRWLPACSTFS